MVYFVMLYTDYKRHSLHSECHAVSWYTHAISFRTIRKMRSILGQFLRKAQKHELDILYTRCHTSRKINVETRRDRNSFAFPKKKKKKTKKKKKKKTRNETQHICVTISCAEFYPNRTRTAQNRAKLHLRPRLTHVSKETDFHEN
jgi:hypothetical protein